MPGGAGGAAQGVSSTIRHVFVLALAIASWPGPGFGLIPYIFIATADILVRQIPAGQPLGDPARTMTV